MKTQCEHKGLIVRPNDNRGVMFCPDCGEFVRTAEAMTLMFDRIRNLEAIIMSKESEQEARTLT